MKVLQIGLGSNPGGIENCIMNYYRILAGTDVHFDFISKDNTLAFADEIQYLGGNIYTPVDVKQNPVTYCIQLRQIIQNGKYDIVHVNMCSAANILPLRIAANEGVDRIIAHCHNAYAPGYLRQTMHCLNRKRVHSLATIMAACSRKAGAWMFGEAAIQNGDVKIIHNAIDPNKYLFSSIARIHIRETLALKDAFIIGHVGRFDVAKNHELLIEIFAEISKKDSSARLLLVGDGVLKEQIIRRVQDHNLLSKVIMVGTQSDVAGYLSAMDVFLLPSISEGLSLSLVEAQTNGLPCIVSDVIPDEAVFLTEKVEKLSLRTPPAKWADVILSCRNKSRNSTNTERILQALSTACFDIRTETGRIMELYGK